METSSIQTPSNSTRSALGIGDFKLYWIGQTVSMLGDQLHNIAVIWLILLVTSDPLALGLVLALGGIAEAIFSLFGGAVVDQIHAFPRELLRMGSSWPDMRPGICSESSSPTGCLHGTKKVFTFC